MTSMPNVQLRLINDMGSANDQYCPLCYYLHNPRTTPCTHALQQHRIADARSLPSDASFYTDRTNDESALLSPPHAIKARIGVCPQPRRPGLRHKETSRETSLRQLREKQSQESRLRKRESDERLQETYEAQIVAYLGDLSLTDQR